MPIFGSTPQKKVVVRPHKLDGIGFDLLVASPGNEDSDNRIDVESFWSDSDATLKADLQTVVRDFGIRRQAATIVLPHSSYSHFTMNRPNVPAEEVRASLVWAAQEKLDNLPYHTPILDSCFAPELLQGREHNKMHVFVAEESHVRGCVDSIRKSGLRVNIVTVHEIAMNELLREWSKGFLLAYIDLPLNESPSLIIVLDGRFVAYKKLPSINLDCPKDVQRDQFSLFTGEVSRQVTYYQGCLENKFPLKVYGCGERWSSLRKSVLFKSVFTETYPDIELSILDLAKIINTSEFDQNLLSKVQHDLIGGVVASDF